MSRVVPTVRVVSYNILCPQLCTPSYFKDYPQAHLDSVTRLEKVKAKLLVEVGKEAILCIQEVSQLWAGPLTTFFAQHNYHLVFYSYGEKRNGFLGIAIAVPIGRYHIEQTEFVRVTDAITVDPPKRPGLIRSTVGSTIGTTVGTTWSITKFFLPKMVSQPISKMIQPRESPWALAEARNNVAIFLKLKDGKTNKVFAVATYHIPCLYMYPKAMTIHAALVTQAVQKLARGTPLVLAGDFNIEPSSPAYQLLTTGEMDEKSPGYPKPIPAKMSGWKPTSLTPMNSAYVSCKGSEPTYTNYVNSAKSGTTFKGTLDYIFCSAEIRVQSVESVRTAPTVTTPRGGSTAASSSSSSSSPAVESPPRSSTSVGRNRRPAKEKAATSPTTSPSAPPASPPFPSPPSPREPSFLPNAEEPSNHLLIAANLVIGAGSSGKGN